MAETDDMDSSRSSFDYSWSKFQGKTVVLVENENPWFINKDQAFRQRYNENQKLFDDINYRDHADYKSLFRLDSESPTLGYGYSYSDRLGTNCKNTEHFENTNSSDCQIIWIVVCLIIFLIIYKFYKK